MLRKWILGFATGFSCVIGMAQKDITIYRSYLKEDNKQERISFEHTENKKTGISSIAIFFVENYFSKEYYNKNNQIIAQVSAFDSLYYEYYKKDSAVVYSTREGKNIRDHQLVFNKNDKVILKKGYLYNTNQFATIQRYTYLNDTLQIGSAGFHITTLFNETDTSKTDSSFTTYDNKGRITGEYKMSRIDFSKIDSMLITEYTYTDSTKTMWGYEEINGVYVLYKRLVEIFDKDESIIASLRYTFPNNYEGKTEHIYELSEDKKYKITQKLLDYRADGTLWKTRTFRHEEITR